MSEAKAATNGKTEFEKEADMQLAIENIDATQNSLEGLNDQSSEEILKIESKYNKQRDPIYKKRAEKFLLIPGFWHQALQNHPQIGLCISDEESECLQHLLNIFVTENEDIKTGYKMQLVFDAKNNPFFSNETIEKVVTVKEGGNMVSTCTKIEWKEGKNFLEKSEKDAENEDEPHFFTWLMSEDTDAGMDVGELIKEDIWPNPLNYYLSPPVDEEEDDDEEEEDDEDEEEADPEEAE